MEKKNSVLNSTNRKVRADADLFRHEAVTLAQGWRGCVNGEKVESRADILKKRSLRFGKRVGITDDILGLSLVFKKSWFLGGSQEEVPSPKGF